MLKKILLIIISLFAIDIFAGNTLGKIFTQNELLQKVISLPKELKFEIASHLLTTWSPSTHWHPNIERFITHQNIRNFDYKWQRYSTPDDPHEKAIFEWDQNGNVVPPGLYYRGNNERKGYSIYLDGSAMNQIIKPYLTSNNDLYDYIWPEEFHFLPDNNLVLGFCYCRTIAYLYCNPYERQYAYIMQIPHDNRPIVKVDNEEYTMSKEMVYSNEHILISVEKELNQKEAIQNIYHAFFITRAQDLLKSYRFNDQAACDLLFRIKKEIPHKEDRFALCKQAYLASGKKRHIFAEIHKKMKRTTA